jgi:hypothetical protein
MVRNRKINNIETDIFSSELNCFKNIILRYKKNSICIKRSNFFIIPLCPSNEIRLFHNFFTPIPPEGGLKEEMISKPPLGGWG